MSAEEKNKNILGPEVKNVESKDTTVKSGDNVPDTDMAWSNADGGSVSSVAPSINSVTDTEGISLAEQKSLGVESKQEAKFPFPQLFIKAEELINIDIEVVFDPYEGDIYSISQPGMLDASQLESLKVAQYYFKFRPVTYDDMHKYRKEASVYDPKAGELIINRLQLRTFFLINHLRETNLVDSEGNKFVIEIDEETNNMSLQSIMQIFQTVPALLDVVMTLFERKLLILFQVSN